MLRFCMVVHIWQPVVVRNRILPSAKMHKYNLLAKLVQNILCLVADRFEKDVFEQARVLCKI